MQFLSVAGRELRVAARKRSSFRVRMLTSAVALFMSGFSLWFVTLFGERQISGEQLFFALSRMSFICACIVGPALTADCVNEERNDGTLGLLFLTDLHAVSIALGKLAGHGLLALYSILSVVPVMALPALLGGADPASLAKTALVLSVTLLLSLTLGMFTSTLCRKAWVAAALALFLLSLFVLGIPFATLVLRLYQRTTLPAVLELLSPGYSLSMASPTAAMLSGNHLGLALTAQVLLALLFFGLTLFYLPRVWKEGRTGKKLNYLSSGWRTLKYGSGETRRRLRQRLLQINSILWLSCRERFGPAGLAMLLLALAFAFSWIGTHVRLGFPPKKDFLQLMAAWIVGLPFLYICFCFRLAVAASERFATDRKTGALELILCTPMKTREIIRGHWLGLIRRFWAAALVLLALHAFTLNYIIEAIRIEGPLRGFDWGEVLLKPLTHLLGVELIPNDMAPFYIACLAVLTAAILIVILWIALAWLGMALSLKLRREILAPWVSLLLLAVPPVPLFVAILPLIARDKTLFASNLFLQLLEMGATGFFLVLGNALFWLFLAQRWTYRKLRATAVSSAPPRNRRIRFSLPRMRRNQLTADA